MNGSLRPGAAFSHHAMATTFEILFPEGDRDYQAKASRACFDEVDRLEAEISKFVPSSDVSRVAILKPRAPCIVGMDFFECVKTALRVYQDSGGAFDPSQGKMDKLALQAEALTVWSTEEGVLLDFGGLGKGYALDVMASVLLEWGFESFLLHGGESSALALGGPARGTGLPPWTVSLRDPRDQSSSLGRLALERRALGGSGRHLQGDHILDPRTGKPARKRLASWALAPFAAEADAYSTAFMIMEEPEIQALCARRRELGALVMRDNGEVQKFGNWPEPS